MCWFAPSCLYLSGIYVLYVFPQSLSLGMHTSAFRLQVQYAHDVHDYRVVQLLHEVCGFVQLVIFQPAQWHTCIMFKIMMMMDVTQ